MKFRALLLMVIVLSVSCLLLWCEKYVVVNKSDENKAIDKIEINEDSVPTVVVTHENSWDIVTQTWDELLYKNDIYWFQVMLWEESKGVKIKTVDNTIWFYRYNPYYDSDEFKSYLEKWGDINVIAPSSTRLVPDYPNRQKMISIQIVDKDTLQNWLQEENEILDPLWTSIKENIIWSKDWKYYLLFLNTQDTHDEIKKIITNLKCDYNEQVWWNISCWRIATRLVWDRFEI